MSDFGFWTLTSDLVLDANDQLSINFRCSFVDYRIPKLPFETATCTFFLFVRQPFSRNFWIKGLQIISLDIRSTSFLSDLLLLYFPLPSVFTKSWIFCIFFTDSRKNYGDRIVFQQPKISQKHCTSKHVFLVVGITLSTRCSIISTVAFIKSRLRSHNY